MKNIFVFTSIIPKHRDPYGGKQHEAQKNLIISIDLCTALFFIRI